MASYNLVIVESAGKVQSITKYLNGNNDLIKKYGKFIVAASCGHVRDLKKKTLAIDINNNFKPEYEFIADKKKILDDLKKKAKVAKAVFIGSDGDLEGEAIGESIRVALGLGENYKRIVFTEISPKALHHAIEHFGKIDNNQLQAQITRRTLDRLVGFKLSPILWKMFSQSNLSAGRVQSAVLHLLIEKENEIREFSSKSYWVITGRFTLNGHLLENVKLNTKLHEFENVSKFFKKLQNKYTLKDMKTKESSQKPDLPYITSSLQIDAGFSVKRTMQLAQELYEAGHITYMRTDSYNMSEDFKKEARHYVKAQFGEKYLGDETDIKKAKTVKGAQEAHECIRPVHVDIQVLEGLSNDHQVLYTKIWKRTIAYFMKKCIYDELEICFVDASFKSEYFIANFKKIRFNGYLKVYGIANDSIDFDKFKSASSKADIKCIEINAKQTWQNPPSRYNEVGLVRLMESESIGRPSTYASTIQRVTDRQYVEKLNIEGVEKVTRNFVYDGIKQNVKEIPGSVIVGQERGVYVPTDAGIKVDAFLTTNFHNIIDKTFTVTMEAELDRVADGTKSRLEVLLSFWKPFSKDLDKFQNIDKNDKIKIEKPASKNIVVKGIEYVIGRNKYGPFLHEKETKKYVDLANYIKYVGKDYLDLTKTDVEFLTKLPITVSKDVVVLMGRYGLYMKKNGENVRMTLSAIKRFIATGEIEV